TRIGEADAGAHVRRDADDGSDVVVAIDEAAPHAVRGVVIRADDRASDIVLAEIGDRDVATQLVSEVVAEAERAGPAIVVDPVAGHPAIEWPGKVVANVAAQVPAAANFDRN